MIATVKACTKCLVEKSLEDFHKDSASRDGLSHRCKDCACANTKEHRARRVARDPDYVRASDLRRFGLTIGDYERMLLTQGGCCAICETLVPGAGRSRFCVDHNHATGEIRGLLCVHCNMGIGQLGDSYVRLEAAASYLRKADL